MVVMVMAVAYAMKLVAAARAAASLAIAVLAEVEPSHVCGRRLQGAGCRQQGRAFTCLRSQEAGCEDRVTAHYERSRFSDL